jgi:hypothetical protein
MFNRRCLATVLTVVFAGGFAACAFAAVDPGAEYLSDSLVGRILSATQDWGQTGLDTAAFATRQSALKLRIKDKEYARGVGSHANGDVVVELDGQFKEFQADAGMQWLGGQTPGSVVLQVYVDDKKVFDSGVMRENDPAKPVSVSVEGADELRLVATDAGDGIHSDLADWADARLTRNPAAQEKTATPAVDIAPFAQVVTWDPQATTGTKASRVQEMPAADVQTAKGLLRTDRGTYVVPIEKENGCIGLLWHEDRMLHRVAIDFADPAAVPLGSIKLQYWTGESPWQGQWQTTDVAPEKSDNRLTWTFGLQELPRGTKKVRILFADAKQPIEVKSLSAFSRSRWKTLNVHLESSQPGAAKKAEIELYNGVFLGQTGEAANHCRWDTSKPLSAKVRYSAARPYKADRTVLRLRFPETAFGIAVEDLEANDCVYVPHAAVFAIREPAPVTLADYLKKIASQKTVLEQVRGLPDQDFTHAWKVVHNPAQNIMPTMLSLANDNRKFVVHRGGMIQFDEYDRPDDPRGVNFGTIYELAFSVPWHCTPTFGDGKDAKITRDLQGGWLPITVTTAETDSISYRETTCVVPMSEPSAGAPSWFRERALCKAEFKISNDSEETNSAKLTLSLGNDNKKPFQLQKIAQGVLAVQGDRILAMIDTREASPLTVEEQADGVVLTGRLAGWGSAECSVNIPAWKVDPKDYAILLENTDRTARVESYWKSLLEPAMQIDVPDKMLSDIIRASEMHCMLAARNGNRGEQIGAWTAAVLYGPLESESNSIIRGMDMVGQPDFARRSLEFYLARCSKEGLITTGYTLVGTGEVLWTLGEHYERTRDRDWMKKVAPEAVKICQWVIRQRVKTKRLDAHGEKVPEYGLMTPGVSADWNRFAYRFFNDAYFYAGLESAGKALADIDDPAARAILDDAKNYREDIVRAYHWNQARSPVVKLDNGTWVPADPALLDCLGRVEYFIPGEDAGRTWAYSIELGSHHLAAVGAIDPKSQDTAWMTDYLEDVQFLRTGMGDYPEAKNRTDVFCFGGFAKCQPYYGRNAEIYAMRDDVKPFIRSYFNAIPTLVNAENLSFCEHFNNYGAWNKTHETGWFLCQTEIMFVQERGDELWLAPFVTTHWMNDGQTVSVRNAPTRFGKVGYTINSAVAKGQIVAVVELPAKCTAKKVVLRLRHPEGKPMQSVTVTGKPHADFDPKNETITLEPTEGKLTIQAQY